MLGDGYFSYTDSTKGYSTVPWFDEFNIELGYPLQKPVSIPWDNHVYRRDFQKGIILINPTDSPKSVTLEKAYIKLKGSQDPQINNGQKVKEITLNGKDGLVLIKTD